MIRAPENAPPMIRTDTSNAFAHNTLRVRVPEIVSRTLAVNPDYPPAVRDALAALRDAMANDAPIAMIDLPAPDYDDWTAMYASHAGETWQGTVWFFAENFAYRHIIQATHWWGTRRDPFAPIKREEMAGEPIRESIEQALGVVGPEDERLYALIHQALWGNRIDLSYAASTEHGMAVGSDDLLMDDTAAVVAHLLGSPPGTVHLVTDNVGRELAADVMLIDALLAMAAERVVLHLKMHPTFVSDATTEDMIDFLDGLQAGHYGPAARPVGSRLKTAIDRGRLHFAPDLYWNSSRVLWDMPPRLERLFRAARLVILKGDANYRRMVGDAVWPPETPFAEAVGYFPAPLLALRTLKSDPIVGLPPGLAEELDTIDPDWRVNGRRGLIQSTAGS